MAACIVALNLKMQRYICAFGRHNRGTLKGNCKRMVDRDKSIKSACHQWTGPESRKQVTEHSSCMNTFSAFTKRPQKH